MLKLAIGLLVATLASVPVALAQQEVDAATLEEGQALYEENCALCHQPGGEGDPPTFPALSGNQQLEDLANIVTNVYQGKGNMPPFPNLGADEIAALATYIRNSWGNELGGVTSGEVAAILEGIGAPGAQTSVWDGVYTEEQAERGQSIYPSACASCHGRRLDGAPDDPDMQSSPPLARAKFLRNWDGKTIATLFEFTRATMPQSNPGYLGDQKYIDLIAYMLSASNIPAGEEELPPNPADLAGIVIEAQN